MAFHPINYILPKLRILQLSSTSYGRTKWLLYSFRTTCLSWGLKKI